MISSDSDIDFYGGNMPFPKNLIFTVFAVVLVSDANAIKVSDYSITLTDDPRLTEIYQKDVYRAMASEIFRQHWNAHLAKVRMQNRENGNTSELTKWESEKYAESVYSVIPTEIARCFFNITNDMVAYNRFNGEAIECINTDVSSYSNANWNYVFLVNLIDKFMANTIETYSSDSKKKLFERALNDTAKALLEAKWANGYSEKIKQAFDDIKGYCSQLQLQEYLSTVMEARLECIKFKSAHNDNIEKAKEYRQQIENFDKSPEWITEIDKNVWMRMMKRFKNIKCNQMSNKVLGGLDWAAHDQSYYIGEYTKRDEYRYYIDQYGYDKLFNSYRMVFGKFTDVGFCNTDIKKIDKNKYIKLSSTNWKFDLKSLRQNDEYEYEGFHPLPAFQEFFIPQTYDIFAMNNPYFQYVQWKAESFGIINDRTESKPYADYLKISDYLDFYNITRLSLKKSEPAAINDITGQIKKKKPSISNIDKEFSQYIRYGDIMATAGYVINYMDYINDRVQKSVKKNYVLDFYNSYISLKKTQRLTKLLRIARNMLPSEQHMDTMADIISEVLRLKDIANKKASHEKMTEQNEILLLLRHRLYGKDQYESEKIFDEQLRKTDIRTIIIKQLNEILKDIGKYIDLPPSHSIVKYGKQKRPRLWSTARSQMEDNGVQ